ncbi:MAG: FimV/HubP family polar landmark protein [Pseudomonadales bacterium]
MHLRLAGIGALLIGWIGNAWALGLGEIELNSHLNQKLVAEIPLVDADGLGKDEIIVSLASNDDFDRAGVERFFYLSDLRFEVMVDGRGTRIRASSARPVTEPYLNFIVEVLWPKGRLLKEFTVLLDPPTYQAEVKAPVAPPPVSRPVPGDRSGEPMNLPSGQPAVGATRVTPGDGVSTTGQTLWALAQQHLPASDLKVNQYMLAIVRENPEAFIGGNVNLMKAGYRLRMPGADAARSVSVTDAAREVAQQNAAWRNGTPATAPTEIAAAPAPAGQAAPELRAQIDASSEAPVPAAPAGGTTSGRLEIVADNGAGGGADSPAANADVAALQEENERLQREVQELGYQSDRDKELAANQIAVKDRQLEVKDQQLAELRSQLDEMTRRLGERGAQPSPDQNQPQAPWWQSSTVLVAGGLIVVLALLAGLVLARRRRQVAQDAAFGAAYAESAVMAAPAVAATAVAVAPTLLPADKAAEAEEEDVDLFLDTQDEDRQVPLDMEDGEQAASPSRQTSDVIGEADIYAAYGRYPHAIGLLLGALEEDPQRHDVRLKLLEVAVAAGDTETFDQHMGELVKGCDDQDILLAARELEESFGGHLVERPHTGASTGDANAEATDDPLALDDLLDTEDDEFRLDIDDLDDNGVQPAAGAPDLGALSDLNADGLASASAEAPEAGAFDEDDLLADAEQDYSPIAADAAEEGHGDMLGGDLGIDFDAEDDGRANVAESDDPLDDDLDIDDLLADLDDTASPVAVPAPAGDDDLEFPLLEDEAPVDDGPVAADTTEEALVFELDDDTVNRGVTAAPEAETPPDEDGLGELDDLLASLDDLDESPADDVGAEPVRSAEILTFNRLQDDDELTLDGEDDLDDGFDFGDAENAAETKLDLAQAYIEMGDAEGAQDILTEVMSEGNPQQRQLARSLLDSLAS